MARGREKRARAAVVYPWLWWATFHARRESGSGVLSAFKAAQAAVSRLYA